MLNLRKLGDGREKEESQNLLFGIVILKEGREMEAFIIPFVSVGMKIFNSPNLRDFGGQVANVYII